MLSLSSCTLASYILSALFMNTVVVPLFVFLRFIAGLFFNFFKALTSLCDRLFLGLIILISASCLDIFQVALKGNRVLNLGYPS